MTTVSYLIIHGIVFAAYLVKGLTGFGPAIVFISLGALILPPATAVAISPLLDVPAGLILLWKDKGLTSVGYWKQLILPMLAGVVTGALGLRFLSTNVYSILLSVAIALLGVWFLVKPGTPETQNRFISIPPIPEKGAVIAAIAAGITGGLFGISGPPIIWYFGRRYPKSAFRKIIVPLFLVEAASRSIINLSLGMIQTQDLLLTTSLFPALLTGLFVGNLWFNIIPQHKFERIIGVVLIASAVRLAIG